MPIRNPIDLDVRSQAFLSDFFNFFQKNPSEWFIANESDILLLSNSVDRDLLSTAIYQTYQNQFKEIFKEIVSKGSHANVLMSIADSSRTFQESRSVFFLKLNHFKEELIFCDISNPLVSYVNLTIQSLGFDKNKQLSKNIPIDKYINVNPKEQLSIDEWKTAWLLIIGFSYRQIAPCLEISTTSVENKINSVYGKLEIAGYDSFIYLSQLYGWVKFVPEEFIKNFLHVIK